MGDIFWNIIGEREDKTVLDNSAQQNTLKICEKYIKSIGKCVRLNNGIDGKYML